MWGQYAIIKETRQRILELEAENARLRLVNDFLWRRVNPHAVSEERRAIELDKMGFKPDATFYTMFCGCKVYRDGRIVGCNRHTPACPAGKKEPATRSHRLDDNKDLDE